MGTFIAIIAAIFGIVILIHVLRAANSSIPSTSTIDIGRFQGTLPEGYGYPYLLDGTGYAINVKEGKILTVSNRGRHIFERDKIREFSYVMNGAEKFYAVGNVHLRDRAEIAHKNRALKKAAYQQSGIFLKVADIDIPEIQIKYSSEFDMNRSVEILQQFLDGTLLDYAEYLQRKQARA